MRPVLSTQFGISWVIHVMTIFVPSPTITLDYNEPYSNSGHGNNPSVGKRGLQLQMIDKAISTDGTNGIVSHRKNVTKLNHENEVHRLSKQKAIIGFPIRDVTTDFQLSGLNSSEVRRKRDNAQERTFLFDDYHNSYAFCYDRDVTGNCRYRTDPEDCFRYEWTAYATVQTRGFGKIVSIPPGVFVPPQFGSDRVRVYLTVSCCTAVVQFIGSGDLFGPKNACIVDVRELQWLHPGEIAGIVAAVVLLILIIIIVVILAIRRKRQTQTVVVDNRFSRSRSTEQCTPTRR